MSIGTLSRTNLREALSAVLLEALPDAQEVAHIRLDAVPQGIAERGFALEGFRSRDESGRKDRGSHILKRHTVSIRYAKRLGGDVLADRTQAEADVDGIERALRNSTHPQTADFDCTAFDSVETVEKSGEWLLVDITADVLCMFRLQAPHEPAEALQ